MCWFGLLRIIRPFRIGFFRLISLTPRVSPLSSNFEKILVRQYHLTLNPSQALSSWQYFTKHDLTSEV